MTVAFSETDSQEEQRGLAKNDAQCNSKRKAGLQLRTTLFCLESLHTGGCYALPFHCQLTYSTAGTGTAYPSSKQRHERQVLPPRQLRSVTDRTRTLEYAGNENTRSSSYHKHISGERASRRLTGSQTNYDRTNRRYILWAQWAL